MQLLFAPSSDWSRSRPALRAEDEDEPPRMIGSKDWWSSSEPVYEVTGEVDGMRLVAVLSVRPRWRFEAV
jgi:hypothetical protein